MNGTYLNPSIEMAQKFSAKLIQDPILRKIGIVLVTALALATAVGLGIGVVLAARHFTTKPAGSAGGSSETDEQKLKKIYEDLVCAFETDDQEEVLKLGVAVSDILKSKTTEQIQFRKTELGSIYEDLRTNAEEVEFAAVSFELLVRGLIDEFREYISSISKDELVNNRETILNNINTILEPLAEKAPGPIVDHAKNRMIEALDAEIAKRA